MTTSLAGPETLASPQPPPRPRRTYWLTLLVGVLVLALGFGAGFLTSQLKDHGPTGVADAATVSLIERNVHGYNTPDGDALAATYAGAALITYVYGGGWYSRPSDYIDPKVITRPAARVARGSLRADLGLKITSALAAHDGLVSATFSRADGLRGIVAYDVEDGMIRHQWFVMPNVLLGGFVPSPVPGQPYNAPAW